ncbi:hypothetical protein FACS189456_4550 [Bacteroidia bacterium]|nr:hypothetical protein FACS189456_4550 [Bacteroidia bacterium]
MLVLSEEHQSDLANLLQKAKCAYSKGFFYKTVSSDLSDVNIDDYQLLAFFSPLGIVSLAANFPTFEQGKTIIAAMGATTAKAVVDAGLRLDIPVPTAEAKSMPAAIDLFLSKQKSRSGK